MDWDHSDAASGTQAPTLTVLGGELGEVFFEGTKHRRSERAPAAPAALATALATTRDLFVARSAPAVQAGPAAASSQTADDRVPARLAGLVLAPCRRVLAGRLSAGVELRVVVGERVWRIVPGTSRLDPALPLTSGRRAALRRALDGGDPAVRRAGDESDEGEGDEPGALVVIAYPMRLVLAAQEAGASCPLSRAYRRVLVEAGALLEAVAHALTAAGLEVEPRLHFFDDELDTALALEGVVEVAVAALLVDPAQEAST